MRADEQPTTTAPIADGTDRIAQARKALRRVTLVLYHREGAVVVPLRPGAPVIVGRDASCDVVVDDDSLSRRHARFTLAGGEVLVEDLGSTKGTRAGGQRVDRAALAAGQEVYIGTVAACVHASAGALAATDSHDALRTIVELDLARARYFSRTFALITVRAPPGEGAHVSRFCHRVQQLLRPVDRVAIHSPDTLDVLVPEVSAAEASALARRIVALPGPPALLCGAAMFPGAGSSADALFEAAHASALAASPEQPFLVAAAPAARLISAGDGASRHAPAEADGASTARIVVRSASARALFEMAGRLSRNTIPVLLVGETGTGKEVLARAIHEAGPRATRPMICINCGAIPRNLVESTLFGQVRGAFTGAVDKEGVFESARGGTVLLDELGELPAAAQAALLRVLETKRVTRVGSTREIEVDVRVISATHRDLEAMTESGEFRRDLLYRLNAVTLTLPPLRERREDIAPLAAHFLEQASREHGCLITDFEPSALAVLRAYPWPGNARELRNAVLRAAALARGDLVRVEDLPDRVRAAAAGALPGADDGPESAPGRGAAAPERRAEGAGEGYAARMARLETETVTPVLAPAASTSSSAPDGCSPVARPGPVETRRLSAARA